AAGKGTGLGLSTVLGILKGHGGFLQVQSVVGRGTDFRLYFPASPKPVAKAGPTLPMPLPHGKGETVLLIDDESAVRFVVKTILKKHGYNVIEAADGIQGLELFRNHKAEVNAVLTDMMMPGMHGSEVMKQL